ncbi:Hypothetical protein A7982_03688 [Minicystis rosea]|nr:Hypothetical protein A7982_03688 [Minicystis rosea]
MYGRGRVARLFLPPAPVVDAVEAGYWIEAGSAPRVSCQKVHGFAEALEAALDPLAPAPLRLAITGLSDEAVAWIERWSEDADQVRRALLIRRVGDGAQIVIIATLASHGFGIPTSLAVESVRARETDDIRRSGVHLRVDVQAALARYDAEQRALATEPQSEPSEPAPNVVPLRPHAPTSTGISSDPG